VAGKSHGCGGLGRLLPLLARPGQPHELRLHLVPAMGTGSNGFPLPVSADIALTELLRQVRASGTPESIRVVLFDEQALKTYRRALAQLAVVWRAFSGS
jgi:hypothetical protein